MKQTTKKNLEKKMTNKLFLVGYMGSGKTTVGRQLADRLNYNFLDTDDMLPVGRQNRIDRDKLYSKEKDEYLIIENEILTEFLINNEDEDYIISAGGSATKLHTNKRLMKDYGLVIFLKITPETYCKRMENHSNMVYRNQWNLGYHQKRIISIENFMKHSEDDRYKFADVEIDANGSVEDICSDIESYIIG